MRASQNTVAKTLLADKLTLDFFGVILNRRNTLFWLLLAIRWLGCIYGYKMVQKLVHFALEQHQTLLRIFHTFTYSFLIPKWSFKIQTTKLCLWVPQSPTLPISARQHISKLNPTSPGLSHSFSKQKLMLKSRFKFTIFHFIHSMHDCLL